MKKAEEDKYDEEDENPDSLKKQKTKVEEISKRKLIGKFINHWAVQIFMLLVTVYALIGDDIRILAFEKEADEVFIWLNVAALSLFSLELILSSIGMDKYFGSFFFWLDLISTLSIVLDI